jgi:AcrR family transcriptional regulator
MRADAIRNRKKLLDVAERLFTLHGDAAEMDDIARAAGIGVGTIYRHFATKDLLLREIIVRPIEALIERAEALEDAVNSGAAFFEFFDALVVLANAKHRLIDTLSSGSRTTFGTSAEIQARQGRFRAAFGVLLRRAQAVGAVRGGIGVAEIVAIVNGAFPYLRRYGGTREEHDRLVTFVVEGLKPPAARSEPQTPKKKAVRKTKRH